MREAGHFSLDGLAQFINSNPYAQSVSMNSRMVGYFFEEPAGLLRMASL